MTALSPAFFEHLEDELAVLHNAQYADQLRRADWNELANDVYGQLMRFWEQFDADEPIGVFGMVWDDAGTEYCIEIDYDFRNDLEEAFDGGCFDNEPAVDYSGFIRRCLQEDPEGIWGTMGDDYGVLQTLLVRVALEVLPKTLESTAFERIPTCDPFFVTFAYHHEDLEPVVVHSTAPPADRGDEWQLYPPAGELSAEDLAAAGTHIDWSGRYLETLPEAVGALEGVKFISLTSNRIRRLPGTMCQLTELRRVDLGNNRLTDLPENLLSIPNLEVLVLSGNLLRDLPAELARVERLEHLSIDSNRFEQLTLPVLPRLTHLSVGGNPLTSFPMTICEQPRLEVLDIRETGLTELPDEIRNLKCLEELRLFRCKLRSLPRGLGALSALGTLAASGNALAELPEEIGALESLVTLDLEQNELRSLPQAIGGAKRLRYLDLRKNQLDALPDSIGELTELRNLQLSQNRLRDLPETLSGATKLERLELDDNPLDRLPEVLWKLTSLENLNLSGIQCDQRTFDSLQAALPSCRIFGLDIE